MHATAVPLARFVIGERGATVVELLIATFLLGIALTALAASFPLSLYGVTQGGLQTTATALAQEVIEDAKRAPYGSLASLAAARGAVPGFEAFQREVLVADYTPATGCAAEAIGGTTISGCRQIRVRVYFTGRQGEVQTTLTTIIARP